MTWVVWRVSPFITSIFFVLGVFTLYEVLIDWISSKIHRKFPNIKDHTIEAWFGVIYIVIFVFSLQLTIAGRPVSWEFMNFQLIAAVFCAYFLKIHISFYAFVPIVVTFMLFNSSITYWESWLYSLMIILFYRSMNLVYDFSKRHHYSFLLYIATGTIYGGILWFLVKIKFSLSWMIYLQEVGYLIIFEILLYSYVRMLLRNDDLRARLVSSANHDALTNAKNYAAYASEIKYLFKNCQTNNLNLSMAMFDIDHFKNVNDTYGHLAGDEVLKHVVSVTQTVIDNTDSKIKLYRTGGEEFNIIFPEYDMDETRIVVREIFSGLNNSSVYFDGKRINISVSMGLSELSKSDLVPNDFYNRVDGNLYHSKKNGRMQITAI